MNIAKNIFDEISRRLASEESFILATIVRTEGSSPREAGAKMLISPDGTIHGTIGGGTFEKKVIEDSLGLFKTEVRCQLKIYKFSESGPDSTGMACGGEAHVFLERNSRPDRLFIFGGGHIGKSLAKIVEGLNFRVTVIDDRQEMLDKFHTSVETVLTDSSYKENFPQIDRQSYIAIVTRNHSSDMAILEKVIMENCAYTGMIGSKKKVKKIFSALKEKGVDEKSLKRVHAPIGLDIGAEGPEEIAISIAAELIKVKKQK
jgi:xanthine dehydrogenase accessory factor